MLYSHVQRTRVCRQLPPPTGSDVSHRPNANNHFAPSSRPGPKSGVGSCFTVLIMMIQAQLTHSVRVPALSAGAGEGNPYAHLSSRHVPKPSGIQVVYGKQDPTHDWNRYVKRSFKRACRQAITHGRATYKGRTLTVQTSPSEQPHTVVQAKQHTPVPPQRHLKVYCHNVGGLGSGMYEDLMGFLDQSHYDIVLVQETKLREASEYTTARWICVGSGTTAQKHAGVMILVRKSLTNVQEVRHDAVIPGRLLRVRFPLGTTGRLLSVVCAYQYAWNPKDPAILDKRSDFWHKLSHCIGGIPYREALVVGGDLNVQLTPKRPCVGHGTGALSPERAPDADALHTLLSAHTLVALNTWGKPGKGAHTFTFGKHQAQLDYLLMRASQTTRMARQARPLHTCPVGGWRHGGGIHTPIVASLPFFYHVYHKPTELKPKVDATQIVQLAQAKDPHSDPAVARFRSEVQEQLTAVNTVSDAGNISQIVCHVAAKYFPQETPHTDKLTRWQEPHIKQGIKDMWKAWRKYRSCNKDTTLKAAIGRWKTWAQYNKLYKKHKEHCRTAKKDYLLQQMNTAEQAAQNHNQRLSPLVSGCTRSRAKSQAPQIPAA